MTMVVAFRAAGATLLYAAARHRAARDARLVPFG